MKRITVSVKLYASHEGVRIDKDGIYVVRANSKPIEGAANKRVLELLAEFLQIPESSLLIRSGYTSRKKIIEILQ